MQKPLADFPLDPNRPDGYYPYCKPCKSGYMRENFQANKPERRLRERRYRIKKVYGITPERYEEMLEAQGGGCAICGTKNPVVRKDHAFCGMSFAVDHCHETGRVRGLLCGPCNLGIGSLKDDPELVAKALDYLRS